MAGPTLRTATANRAEVKLLAKNRDGPETRDKSEILPMKPGTSFDEDSIAGYDKRRKKKTNKKRKNSKTNRRSLARDTSSDDLNAFYSEAFDAEKKRTRPKESAEVGQDVSIRRAFLRVSTNRTKSRTKEEAADMLAKPVPRKRGWK